MTEKKLVERDADAMDLLLKDLEAYKGREGYTEMEEKARMYTGPR